MVDQILNFIKNKYFIGTVAAVVVVYAALSFNQYLSEEQNKKDFKKFHNLDVNELDGLAIMSDTDNSKMKAIAYYQNIYFSSE